MSTRQNIVSAVQIFMVLFLCTCGVSCFLPNMKTWFLDNPERMGALFLTLGFCLFLICYLLNRGRFLVIKMGVIAKPRLVEETLQKHLAKRFSDSMLLLHVEVQKGSIAISVKAQVEEQLFQQLENEISALLHERFGYEKPFYLHVSN